MDLDGDDDGRAVVRGVALCIHPKLREGVEEAMNLHNRKLEPT